MERTEGAGEFVTEPGVTAAVGVVGPAAMVGAVILGAPVIPMMIEGETSAVRVGVLIRAEAWRCVEARVEERRLFV